MKTTAKKKLSRKEQERAACSGRPRLRPSSAPPLQRSSTWLSSLMGRAETTLAEQGDSDQAGTYVNRIASSPTRSLATRRSGDRGPAKNGLPRPSTTGRR